MPVTSISEWVWARNRRRKYTHQQRIKRRKIYIFLNSGMIGIAVFCDGKIPTGVTAGPHIYKWV